MNRVKIGILVLVAFIGALALVGHAQEWVYCRGLIQGQIDAFSAFLGPLSPTQPAGYWDGVLTDCYARPNNPWGYRPQFPLFWTGNVFDSVLDTVKRLLP